MRDSVPLYAPCGSTLAMGSGAYGLRQQFHNCEKGIRTSARFTRSPCGFLRNPLGYGFESLDRRQRETPSMDGVSLWRRERDSNPCSFAKRKHDFESCAFNRTLPSLRMPEHCTIYPPVSQRYDRAPFSRRIPSVIWDSSRLPYPRMISWVWRPFSKAWDSTG